MQHHTPSWMCPLFIVLALPGARSQSLYDFFDGSKLQEIRLAMNAADWVMLKQNYLADTYYRCDFQWQAIVVRNSGVKSRGTGSRSPIKPGLGIHFAAYNPSQSFLGLQSIVLRNFAQDASRVHERLTMEMFQRMGLPYERDVHAKLFINGVYVGLFLAVEPLDERFTLTRFGERDGYLYEYHGTGQPFYFNYLGDDPTLYVPGRFEAKTNEYAPQPDKLRDMIYAASVSSDADFAIAMKKYLDLGSFVTHVAAEEFLSEVDGLMDHGMRNFYLYRRLSDDRFVFLVWDKESTFAATELPIFYGTDENVLMRRALAVPEFRLRYLQALLEAAMIAGGPGGWLEQEAKRMLDQIREAVLSDPSRICLQGNAGIQPCPMDQFEVQERWLATFGEYRSAYVTNAVAAAGMRMPDRVLVPGSATNAASLVAQLTPGSLARIEASLSVSQAVVADSLPLPVELSGVSVQIGGQTASIAALAPTGAVVQVPWEVVCGPVSVVVQDQGELLNTISVEVRPSSPGIFSVTHLDGTPVDAARPVHSAEVLAVYATGLGPAAVMQISGNAPSGGVPLRNDVSAVVGELPASVLWAGLSPGILGMQQVNITIPAGAPSGTAALRLIINGETGAQYAIEVR